VLIAAGLPGYGKTHYVQEGLGERRVLIIDPHAVLDRSHAGEGKREPWQGELALARDEILARTMKSTIFAFTGRLVVDPQSVDEQTAGRRVKYILDCFWKSSGGDLVLEEAGLYSRAAISMINVLSTGSGHNNIRVILLTQSIGRITIDARRNVSYLALWPQADPNDYRELRGKIGKAGVRTLATMPEPPPYSPPVTWRQGQVDPALLA
jgi:hypothetical protein